MVANFIELNGTKQTIDLQPGVDNRLDLDFSTNEKFGDVTFKISEGDKLDVTYIINPNLTGGNGYGICGEGCDFRGYPQVNILMKGGDLVIEAYKTLEDGGQTYVLQEKLGTLTFKGYMKKDLGADITFNGHNYQEEAYFYLHHGSVDFWPNGKMGYPGTALAENIDVSDFDYEANRGKGVTIDAKDGDNVIIGSGGHDTIKTGCGDDTITASKGDDKYTLGAGENTVTYDTVIGKDTYTLTKGEVLNIDVTGDSVEESIVKNDVVIQGSSGGSIVLKNYSSKDVGEVYLNGYDLTTFDFQKEDFTKGALNLNSRFNIEVDASDFDAQDGIKNVKITTGKGFDEITLSGDQSFTVNAKDGENTVTVNAAIGEFLATNKITTGKNADTITVSSGKNTINAGAGENTITVYDGENKITTGKDGDMIEVFAGKNTISAGAGENTITINNGNNKITTGKDGDMIEVFAGKNTINAGAGENIITINDGDNVIKAGAGLNTINIDGGVNSVTTGKDADLFNITDGSNVINAGNGHNEFIITDGNTVITAGKGNDIYDLSSFGSIDPVLSSVTINDKGGQNVMILHEDTLDSDLTAFFRLKLDKKGNYSFCDNKVTLTTKETALDAVLNMDPKAKSITAVATEGDIVNFDGTKIKEFEIDGSSYEIDYIGIAQNVASWLSENGYNSTDAVLATRDYSEGGAIQQLVAQYTTGAQAGDVIFTPLA